MSGIASVERYADTPMKGVRSTNRRFLRRDDSPDLLAA